LQAQIREFTPVAGTSVRNPLDTVGIRGRDQFLAAVRIVASSPDIHLLLIQSRIDWTPGTGQDSMEWVAQGVDALEQAAKVGGKPVVAVIWPPTSAGHMSRALAFQERCAQVRIPTFWSVALQAVARVIDWHESRSWLCAARGVMVVSGYWPSQVPYEEFPLPELLRRSAERFGDKPALIGADGTVRTYRELWSNARKVARFLQDHGIEKGERGRLLMADTLVFYGGLGHGAT
jgi:hypothetical protein